MKTPRAVLTVILTIGLLTAPLAAEAQPTGKIARIGYVTVPQSVLVQAAEVTSRRTGGDMAMEKVQSVGELATLVAADPELQKAIKDNPVQALASLAAPLRSDVMIYRMVVGALGLTLMVAAIGVIALAFFERSIPDSLVAFGSGCVGALAGLLAPSPVARE